MNPDVPLAPSSVSGPAVPAEAGENGEDREFLERIDRILAGQEPPPLMTTPPEVQAIVDREVARFPPEIMTPEARQRLTDDLNMQYHYGGQEVLTWQTPRGRAVLAVGMDQIGRVLDHITAEQCLEVLMDWPNPW